MFKYIQDIFKTSKLIIIDDMRHLIEPPVFDQFKEDLLEHLKTNK